MDTLTKIPSIQPVTRGSLLRLTLVVEGGLLLAALLAGYFSPLPLDTMFRPEIPQFLTGLAVGAGLFALVTLFLALPTRLGAALDRDVNRIVVLFRNTGWFDLLLISLLAGIGEEAFFRGLLQTLLAEYVGVPGAILSVSVVFGLVHFVSRAYVMFAILLSIPFGLLYAYSGNLVASMVAHAFYDFIALSYAMYFRPVGRPQ